MLNIKGDRKDSVGVQEQKGNQNKWNIYYLESK
jgi:hypothetical protein